MYQYLEDAPFVLEFHRPRHIRSRFASGSSLTSRAVHPPPGSHTLPQSAPPAFLEDRHENPASRLVRLHRVAPARFPRGSLEGVFEARRPAPPREPVRPADLAGRSAGGSSGRAPQLG